METHAAVLQAAVKSGKADEKGIEETCVPAVTQVQSICEHIFSQLADTGTSDKVRAVLMHL